MDEEITCERCGARVPLTVGANGWPLLNDAASIADAHRECLVSIDQPS